MSNPSEDQGYLEAFEEYGESPEALQWIDYRSMGSRFRQLVADVPLEGRSILDVGCGMGDLLPFIYAKANQFKYLGVDTLPEFIEIAKKRYGGHNFRVADPFAKNYHEKYDIVLLSGVMNPETPNWQQTRLAQIKKLYDLAHEAAAFNLAGSFNDYPLDGKIAYSNTQDVLDFCKTLTSRLILKTHYNHRDFTIVMFK